MIQITYTFLTKCTWLWYAVIGSVRCHVDNSALKTSDQWWMGPLLQYLSFLDCSLPITEIMAQREVELGFLTAMSLLTLAGWQVMHGWNSLENFVLFLSNCIPLCADPELLTQCDAIFGSSLQDSLDNLFCLVIYVQFCVRCMKSCSSYRYICDEKVTGESVIRGQIYFLCPVNWGTWVWKWV